MNYLSFDDLLEKHQITPDWYRICFFLEMGWIVLMRDIYQVIFSNTH